MGAEGSSMIIMIVLMFAIMYFLMIRPENKRKKKAQEMRDSLKKGDVITSIGGIVGKIGQTSASNLGDGTTGGIIENCVNFATVHNTDSKGCGGIVGAGWNRVIIRNCANFGSISTIYNNPTGGIVGSD